MVAKPIVSDSDFVTFDLTNQVFTTTAKAAQHLNGLFDTNVLSIPFVLVASGEPIYVGVFESPFSSYLYFDFPVVHQYGLDSTNRAFEIQIRALRPTDANAVSTNVLNDPRIVSAVRKLFNYDKK